MKQFLVGVAIAVLSATTGAQQPEGPVEALDGADPVLLVQGKDVMGKPDLKVVRGRFIYLFSTPETKATFEKTPEKYEIQLGGLCARMGSATGNPSDFFVHEERIYIFASDSCHKRFAAAPAKFLPKPASPLPTSSAAIASGKALLDRAVTAAGGAAVIDGLTSLVEVGSQILIRQDAEVPVTRTVTWRFPDSVRQEQTMTNMGRTMTSARVMTPKAAFFAAQGRSFPMNDKVRADAGPAMTRHLVRLLRLRHEPGARAASLGRRTMAGTDVEQVRLTGGGQDVTLGIDPSSGRVLTLGYVDRNQEGEIGEYTLVYSDHRTVDGLLVPFSVKALFEGKPDAFQSYTVQSVKVNAPVDPALFEPVQGK